MGLGENVKTFLGWPRLVLTTVGGYQSPPQSNIHLFWKPHKHFKPKNYGCSWYWRDCNIKRDDVVYHTDISRTSTLFSFYLYEIWSLCNLLGGGDSSPRKTFFNKLNLSLNNKKASRRRLAIYRFKLGVEPTRGFLTLLYENSAEWFALVVLEWTWPNKEWDRYN